MGIFLVFLLLLWQVLPIILLIALLILHSNYKSLKKKYEQIIQGNSFLPHQAAPPPVSHQPIQPPPNLKPQFPQTPIINSPESLAKTKEKQTQQVVNITLIIGMLFILTAGLIFATTTWNIISNIMKVLCIAIFALIFFAATFLIRRFFKIRLTEIAFYHLGCLFLCATVLSLGFFEILGSWFSLWGNGRAFVFLLTMLLLFALSIWGYRCYKAIHLYYLSWGSSACIVWFLAESLGSDQRTCWLFVFIYGALVLTRMLYKTPQKWMLYVHPFLILYCLEEITQLYLPSFEVRSVTFVILMGLSFGCYRFSKRIFPISLDTGCSQFLFPFMLLIDVLVSGITPDNPFHLLSSMLLCACLWSLFLSYKKPVAKYLLAALIVLNIGLFQYALLQLLVRNNLFSHKLGITFLYSLFIILMFFARKLPWLKKTFFHFQYMFDVLLIAMTLYGITYCGTSWSGTIMLWLLFAFWFSKKGRSVYIPIATLIWLILPAFTIKNCFPTTAFGIQLLIIGTALVTYIAHYYLLMSYRRKVCLWVGISSLFSGLFLFSVSYWSFKPLEQMYVYGLIGIAIILLTLLFGWRKKDPLLYGTTLFLAPILYTVMPFIWDVENVMVITGFSTSFFLMVLGRILYPNLSKPKNTTTSMHALSMLKHVDLLSISAITGLFGTFFTNHSAFGFLYF